MRAIHLQQSVFEEAERTSKEVSRRSQHENRSDKKNEFISQNLVKGSINAIKTSSKNAEKEEQGILNITHSE